ncbi:MAG TPA: glycosyltransferase family 2 protein [Burkholderiales bacterium]|nr:glycosyltransferase family 2 protein [Burkholderiales bacterium]
MSSSSPSTATEPSAAAPKFSIAVATYRRPELLKECVASVLRQTCGDFELLVGNDFPGEKLTRESLGTDDPRVRVINNEVNLRPWGNMNKLLGLARGSYLIWLADDDMLAADHLEAVAEALRDRSAPGAVITAYCSGQTFSGEAQGYRGKIEIMTGRAFMRGLTSRRLGAVGFAVYEKQHLLRIGGIAKLGNGPFSPYNDTLLGVSAGTLRSVAFIHSPLYFFRTHSESPSASSTNVEMFFTAQVDYVRRSAEVLREPALLPDFNRNLADLLAGCIGDFFVVIARSGLMEAQVLGKYTDFMCEASSPLPRAAKLRLRALLAAHLARAALNIARYRLRNGAGRLHSSTPAEADGGKPKS